MDSPLKSFLLAEVPGWDDDVVSTARFKALTGQKTDWEGRFLFWKERIIQVARHLNLLVIDTDAVEHHWFLRGGLVPLCIHQVLVKMYNCGDLQKVDMQKGTQWSVDWFWSQIRKGVFWASESASNTRAEGNSIGGRLVVTSLLHDRLLEVIKTMTDSSWTASCIITAKHFTSLCGGIEDANILKRELVRANRGRYFVADGKSRVKGLKISLTQDHVPGISKLDCYMLHLYSTVEKLQIQMDLLEKAFIKSKNNAVTALQQKDKVLARRHAQSLRALSASKSKCAEFQMKIEELISFISQAEMTKQVSEAMKAGKDTLKEHVVPLEDIEACLDELDETISLHKEAANALGSFIEGDDVDDLDLELAELELEDTSEKNKENSQLSMVKINCVAHDEDQAQPNAFPAPSTHVEAVEKVMKGLSLEPEPA